MFAFKSREWILLVLKEGTQASAEPVDCKEIKHHIEVTGSAAIFERLGMPNVVLKLGSVCPPVPLPLIEFCRSRALALGNWLGNSGCAPDILVGVKAAFEDRTLMDEALLKVRFGGGGNEAGEWFREGVGYDEMLLLKVDGA